jgi:hypothetical protein
MKSAGLRLAVALLLACLLSACPETTVDENFGLKPLELQPEDWNGLWTPVDDDEKMKFTIIAPDKGVLRISDPEDKKGKPTDLRLHRASADEKAELFFALMVEQDEREAKNQIMLMRKAEKDILVAWMIDDEAIEAAIKSGDLKGTTRRVKNDPHNHLASDPANYPRLLSPQYWQWTEPMMLKRVVQR